MHYLWLLHRKEMFRPVIANEQNEFHKWPVVGCLCWFWVTVAGTPPSVCDPVWVQLNNIHTFGGNVSIAKQFWHVRCWLPLNLNLWLRSVKILITRDNWIRLFALCVYFASYQNRLQSSQKRRNIYPARFICFDCQLFLRSQVVPGREHILSRL